jgi:hypothetical protein
MDKASFITKIEEVCEFSPGTLNGSECLADSMLFNSLAILDLAVMFDKIYKVNISIKEIMCSQSIDELYSKFFAK